MKKTEILQYAVLILIIIPLALLSFSGILGTILKTILNLL